MNQVLGSSGLVVIALGLRGSPRNAYPSSIADFNYGTRWAKAHGSEFNGDASAVGGFGGSSGGHIVVLSAMRPDDARYRATPLPQSAIDATLAYIVALSPILDPLARYSFAQQTNRQDLIDASDAYFGSLDVMQEANPQLMLARGEQAKLPPVLLLQGTEDQNVTVQMQRAFATAYGQAGGSIELALFPGAPHYFANTPGANADRALRLTKEFVARQLTPIGTVAQISSAGLQGSLPRL